jgi:hypothetical protein
MKLALLLMFLASTGQAQAPKADTAPDRWEGTWTALPGRQGMPENTLILKDGDGYRLHRPPYEAYRFKEVGPGVLECENVGKIRRGKLTMTDRPGETVVLHAEFCYEQFYLFYAAPPPAK